MCAIDHVFCIITWREVYIKLLTLNEYAMPKSYIKPIV